MNYLQKVKLIVARIQAVNQEPKVSPGLSKTEIINTFNSINLVPLSEIIELYQWHNVIIYLNGFLSLMDLDYAMD